MRRKDGTTRSPNGHVTKHKNTPMHAKYSIHDNAILIGVFAFGRTGMHFMVHGIKISDAYHNVNAESLTPCVYMRHV